MKKGDKVIVTNPSNDDYGRTGTIYEIKEEVFWLEMHGKNGEHTGYGAGFDEYEIKLIEGQ